MFEVNMKSLKLVGFTVIIFLIFNDWRVLSLRYQATSKDLVFENTAKKSSFESSSRRRKHLQNDDISRTLVEKGIRPVYNVKHLLKNLRKREVDFCKDFRPKTGKGYVSSCKQPYTDSLFCDGDNCPNKPSYPNGVPHVKQKLNGTTKNVDIEISWKEPAFGKNNLCGFLLLISSLSRFAPRSACIQIHSKTQLSHVVYGVPFDTKYNITVVSLPAYKDMDRSSKYVEVKVAEKCTIFKQNNVSLPWECVLPSRVKTTKCINGTVNISLVKPGNAAFDNYLVMIVPGNRISPGSVFIHKYGKEDDRAVINRRLHSGIKFVALVFYQRESKNVHSIASKPFICEGKPTIVKTSQCRNANVTATWDKVKIYGVRYKVSLYVVRSESQHEKISEEYKDQTSTDIVGLEREKWYIVKISIALRSNQIIIGESSSNRFSCGGVRDELYKEPNKPVSLSLIIILAILTATIIVLLAILYRYRRSVTVQKWIYHFRNRRRLERYREDSDLKEEENVKNSVLLLYPSGCKCLENFALLLAKALGQVGCKVYLDLYNKIQAAQEGGREMYMQGKIREASRVVMIFSEETNENSWGIFIGHVRAILKMIIEKTEESSKYVPITLSKVDDVDVWNGIKARTDPIESIDTSEKFTQLLFRCTDTETYEEYYGIPTKNRPGIDADLMGNLMKWANRIKSQNHEECDKNQCMKGKIDDLGYQYDSFNNLVPTDVYYDESSTYSLTDSTLHYEELEIQMA